MRSVGLPGLTTSDLALILSLTRELVKLGNILLSFFLIQKILRLQVDALWEPMFTFCGQERVVLSLHLLGQACRSHQQEERCLLLGC